MSRTELADRLAELHASAERIHATLVELELDSGRQMLEASALTGTTASRWAAAGRALNELWRRQRLLEALLAEADTQRGGRQGERLRALLLGRSVELAGSDVPLVERSLLPGDRAGDRCSPDELLASMSGLFDDVTSVLGAITAAWDVLLPSLEEARGRLASARSLAAGLGEGTGGELAGTAAAVDDLGRRVAADPLAVDRDEMTAILDRLDDLRAALTADAGLRHSVDGRVLEARALLARIRELAEDCRQARTALEVKIAFGSAPAAPLSPDALERDLEAIVLAADGGAWRSARTELEAWWARARAQHEQAEATLRALRAPVQARDQFRALLDAYAVKARRLGRVEDAELVEIFERAREELYTAPTDLGRAADLVRRYQLALSGVSRSEEENR